MQNKMEREIEIIKKVFVYLIIALSPFALIIGVYVYDPTSIFLQEIALRTSHLPAVYSSKSPLFSVVMSLYLKTAPFFAVIVYLMIFKNIPLKKKASRWYLLWLYFLFTVLYFIIIYVFLCTEQELTHSGRLLKLMSMNDIFLSFFYISFYSSIFMITYLYILFGVGTYRAFIERW